MLVTENFIYVHLHKSGGTFLNRFLKQNFGARQLGAHLPCSLIPRTLRGLPVLGFVRNPWSYYVAWYEFQASMRLGNPVFQHLSEGGTLGFRDVLRRLLDLGTDAAALQRLIESLPEAYAAKGANLPRAAFATLRNTRVGFYTHLYNYLYGGHSGRLHLRRTDRLPQEFLGFLDDIHVPISEELRAQVAAQPPPRVDYTGAYDDALRDQVAERDAALIRSFDYRFGD